MVKGCLIFPLVDVNHILVSSKSTVRYLFILVCALCCYLCMVNEVKFSAIRAVTGSCVLRPRL
jgi:hypothetical protein